MTDETEDLFYPVLSDKARADLEMIGQMLAHHPDYLSSPDCPYPASIRGLFVVLDRPEGEAAAAAAAADELNLDTEVDLLLETTRLFNGLMAAKDSFTSNDHSEKMAYFRTSTSLLDKLVGLKERAQNVRQVSRFYTAVLDVMEQVLEPGQISLVREKLKEFTNE